MKVLQLNEIVRFSVRMNFSLGQWRPEGRGAGGRTGGVVGGGLGAVAGEKRLSSKFYIIILSFNVI